MGPLDGGPGGARRRGRPWWLIVRHEGGFLEVMALGLGGGERAVAVFSFGEEAELFLRFEAGVGAEPGDRWRVRQTAPEELASLLLGPLSGAGRVALDPLPGRLGRMGVRLVSTDREGFVERLLERLLELGPRPRGPGRERRGGGSPREGPP